MPESAFNPEWIYLCDNYHCRREIMFVCETGHKMPDGGYICSECFGETLEQDDEDLIPVHQHAAE